METKRLIDATCPDCRGPLSETQEDSGPVEYRCLVGHLYSARTMLQAHSDTQERALWAAVVALEESAQLVQSVAGQFPPQIAQTLEAQANKKLGQAQELRGLIQRVEPYQTE